MKKEKSASNSNGKLPTAKDFESLKIKLTEAEKKRVASTKAVLKELTKDEKTGRPFCC